MHCHISQGQPFPFPLYPCGNCSGHGLHTRRGHGEEHASGSQADRSPSSLADMLTSSKPHTFLSIIFHTVELELCKPVRKEFCKMLNIIRCVCVCLMGVGGAQKLLRLCPVSVHLQSKLAHCSHCCSSPGIQWAQRGKFWLSE